MSEIGLELITYKLIIHFKIRLTDTVWHKEKSNKREQF